MKQDTEKGFFCDFKLKIITDQTKFLLVTFSIFLSIIVSAFSFLIRTTYFSDLGLIETNFFRAARMTLVYMVFPYLFTRNFLTPSYSIEDIGLTLHEIKKGFFFGMVLYTVALIVIISQFGDPNFENDWVDSIKSESLTNLVFYAILASIMAAITDLWVRGYILFQCFEYSSIHFALLIQTLIWMAIHWYEIILLTPSLGFFTSFFLALFLGLGGGLTALKTRNIVGLIIGHVWLNIGFLMLVIVVV